MTIGLCYNIRKDTATKYPTAVFGPCYFTEMIKLNLKEVVVMMIKYHV